jgi:hypothetical protein
MILKNIENNLTMMLYDLKVRLLNGEKKFMEDFINNVK